MMHISQEGVERIKAFEGLQCNAYPCGAKKWTFGYGHTIGGKEKEVFAPAQAETFKRDDIDAAVIRLNVLLTVPVT
ncbi:hypothetical protein AAH678_08595 [Sodalis endosymbiont of Spalangia cameroni]